MMTGRFSYLTHFLCSINYLVLNKKKIFIFVLHVCLLPNDILIQDLLTFFFLFFFFFGEEGFIDFFFSFFLMAPVLV